MLGRSEAAVLSRMRTSSMGISIRGCRALRTGHKEAKGRSSMFGQCLKLDAPKKRKLACRL